MKTYAWTINGLLAVILGLLGYYFLCCSGSPAFAAGGGWETNNVMAMHSGGTGTDRLVLIDTNKQNIMVYRTQGMGTFRLVGARSYKYDIEMEDTSLPTVPGLIESQGVDFFSVYKMYQARTK